MSEKRAACDLVSKHVKKIRVSLEHSAPNELHMDLLQREKVDDNAEYSFYEQNQLFFNIRNQPLKLRLKCVCKGIEKSYNIETLREIEDQTREILVEWLIEVHYYLNLLPETLFLGVYIMDRYVNIKDYFMRAIMARYGQKEWEYTFQYIGITSLLLAIKYIEVESALVKRYFNLVQSGLSRLVLDDIPKVLNSIRKNICRTELDILFTLDFRLSYYKNPIQILMVEYKNFFGSKVPTQSPILMRSPSPFKSLILTKFILELMILREKTSNMFESNIMVSSAWYLSVIVLESDASSGQDQALSRTDKKIHTVHNETKELCITNIIRCMESIFPSISLGNKEKLVTNDTKVFDSIIFRKHVKKTSFFNPFIVMNSWLIRNCQRNTPRIR